MVYRALCVWDAWSAKFHNTLPPILHVLLVLLQTQTTQAVNWHPEFFSGCYPAQGALLGFGSDASLVEATTSPQQCFLDIGLADLNNVHQQPAYQITVTSRMAGSQLVSVSSGVLSGGNRKATGCTASTARWVELTSSAMYQWAPPPGDVDEVVLQATCVRRTSSGELSAYATRVQVRASGSSEDIVHPTPPPQTALVCEDSQSWKSKYGYCSDYARGTTKGEMNFQYCQRDGAEPHCPQACGKCDGCGPGQGSYDLGQDQSQNAVQGSSQCMPCAKGTFNNDWEVGPCTACAPGSHAPDMGMLECWPCPVGTISSVQGRHECADCPAGRFVQMQGQATCTLCPRGTFSRSSSGLCQPCPRGTYSADRGTVTCRPCKGNFDTLGATSCAATPAPTREPTPKPAPIVWIPRQAPSPQRTSAPSSPKVTQQSTTDQGPQTLPAQAAGKGKGKANGNPKRTGNTKPPSMASNAVGKYKAQQNQQAQNSQAVPSTPTIPNKQAPVPRAKEISTTRKLPQAPSLPSWAWSAAAPSPATTTSATSPSSAAASLSGITPCRQMLFQQCGSPHPCCLQGMCSDQGRCVPSGDASGLLTRATALALVAAADSSKKASEAAIVGSQASRASSTQQDSKAGMLVAAAAASKVAADSHQAAAALLAASLSLSLAEEGSCLVMLGGACQPFDTWVNDLSMCCRQGKCIDRSCQLNRGFVSGDEGDEPIIGFPATTLLPPLSTQLPPLPHFAATSLPPLTRSPAPLIAIGMRPVGPATLFPPK